MWTLMLHFSEKPRPQCLQWNGFSPVWLRTCRSRCEGRSNTFPQIWHVWFWRGGFPVTGFISSTGGFMDVISNIGGVVGGSYSVWKPVIDKIIPVFLSQITWKHRKTVYSNETILQLYSMQHVSFIHNQNNQCHRNIVFKLRPSFKLWVNILMLLENVELFYFVYF